ncbi:MAG: hypothetical protein PWR24_1120 [Desulfonauticus sp.]|nr:MAG: hypothetical protein XD41_1505 [Desulfonauticus sp. 38_4375]MDK2921563.1 hypothetical protein [Desulfonauticus sp.]
MKKQIYFSLISLFFLVLFNLRMAESSSPEEWSQAYERLHSRIEKNYNQPKGDPPELEPYLQWMEAKARDRDEVEGILEEIK